MFLLLGVLPVSAFPSRRTYIVRNLGRGNQVSFTHRITSWTSIFSRKSQKKDCPFLTWLCTVKRSSQWTKTRQTLNYLMHLPEWNLSIFRLGSVTYFPYASVCCCCLVAESCPTPSSMRCLRQEYWSGLPFPSPGDLLDPGIKCILAGGFFTTEPPGKPQLLHCEMAHKSITNSGPWLFFQLYLSPFLPHSFILCPRAAYMSPGQTKPIPASGLLHFLFSLPENSSSSGICRLPLSSL